MSNRIEMMGCQIDNLSMAETLQTIEGFIHSGKPHQHVVVNVDKLVKASRDPENCAASSMNAR
jgi:N-acetylglucosaminyldiphosphoundecaprenol N-acetyl-beta-D-mannosaminyltransferase